MNRDKRTQIFERLRAANPEPTTELDWDNPFQLLIAVILSAQATDVSVNKATGPLFRDAPDAAAIATLGVDGLTPYIRHIGLFNSKSKNVIAACEILLSKHNGEVPRERAALEALPGVGRKTANVVLNTAFGEPTMAVDTHIFRVANRTRIATGKNVRDVEDRLVRFIPREFLKERPPLVDPARSLYVCGAHAALRRVCHRGPVRVPQQDRIHRRPVMPPPRSYT